MFIKLRRRDGDRETVLVNMSLVKAVTPLTRGSCLWYADDEERLYIENPLDEVIELLAGDSR